MITRAPRQIALAFVTVCALVASLAAQPPARPAPTPVDPFTAIIDAFRNHDLVTVSDAHGSKTVTEF